MPIERPNHRSGTSSTPSATARSEDAEAVQQKARADAGRRLGQLKTGVLLDTLYQERQRMLAEEAGQEDAPHDEDAADPTERAEDE